MDDNIEALKRTKEIKTWRLRFILSLFFAIPIVIIRYCSCITQQIESFPDIPSSHSHSMILYMLVEPAEDWLDNDFFWIPRLSINSAVQFLLATPVQFWLGSCFYVSCYKCKATTNSLDHQILYGHYNSSNIPVSQL